MASLFASIFTSQFKSIFAEGFGAEGIPFPADIAADYFSYGYDSTEKKVLTKYWNGVKINGQEVVGGVDTPALVSQRLVAEGDGTSAYMVTSHKFLQGSATFELSCDIESPTDIATKQKIVVEDYSRTNGFYIESGNINFRFRIGGATALKSYAISANTKYKLHAMYNGVNIKFYLDDVLKDTVAITGNVDDVDAYFSVGCYYRTTGTKGDFYGGKVWNVELTTDGVLKAHYPLEGSPDDTSGNGNHLTNNGVDLLAVANNYTDGLYSPALIEGFGVGVEEVTNGDFPTWTGDNPDGWVVVGEVGSDPIVTEHLGGARMYTTSALLELRQINTLVVGNVYVVEYDILEYNFGTLYFATSLEILASSVGHHTHIFQALVDDPIFKRSGSLDCTIDNITIKEAYIPRLDDLSGYTRTVTEEHPALVVGHNMAPVVITFPTTVNNIMDRSNSTVWKSSATSGATYDASHPTAFYPENLTTYWFSQNLQPAFLAVFFMATDANGYLHDASGNILYDSFGYPIADNITVEKLVSFIGYLTNKTASEAMKVVAYEDKQKFKLKT